MLGIPAESRRPNTGADGATNRAASRAARVLISEKSANDGGQGSSQAKTCCWCEVRASDLRGEPGGRQRVLVVRGDVEPPRTRRDVPAHKPTTDSKPRSHPSSPRRSSTRRNLRQKPPWTFLRRILAVDDDPSQRYGRDGGQRQLPFGRPSACQTVAGLTPDGNQRCFSGRRSPGLVQTP